MKVEVTVLGNDTVLMSLTVSVDVMQNVYGLGGAVDIQSRVDSKHDISMTDSR